MKIGSKIFSLENVKIKSKFFKFKDFPDCPIKSPLIIPFGSISLASEYNYSLKVKNNELEFLLATPKNGSKNSSVKILPNYKDTVSLNIIGFGSVDLELWLVKEEIDKIRASEIILRSHYLSVPSRGLILGCRFLNLEQQKQLLYYSSQTDKKDKWSPAWRDVSGSMIACAVLDTLFHGIPKGRHKLVENEGIKIDWNASRREIVEQIKIGWVSRVAVEAPYRNFGFGSLLTKYLRTVAKKYRVPSANYLEVITTLNTEKAKEKLNNTSRDFLKEAGYTRINELYNSSRTLQSNYKGEKMLVPAKKLYYYSKVSESDD